MQNDYQIKKEERERTRTQERKSLERGKTGKSLVRFSVWVIIIIALGYGVVLLARANAPQGEDLSISYEDLGRDHIDDNASHPSYNSNPPSSGWHYVSPAHGGFYDEALPDERVVHNLEHGDIWIAYHPDISDEARSLLEDFAGAYIVVSSRTENEGDISLVAWGKVDTFNIEDGVVDEERIRDFIRRYDNRGPERVRAVQAGHSAI